MSNENQIGEVSLGKSILLGVAVALGISLVFGLLSKITWILGATGAFAAGMFIAVAMFHPFPMVTREIVKKVRPVAIILGLLTVFLVTLIPFIFVIVLSGKSGSFSDTLRLAWVFYKLSLKKLGSTSITTIIGVIGVAIGVPGRVNGLKKEGKYSLAENA